MPHVVLNGKATIEDIFVKMKPLFIRDGESVLKTANMYIERGKGSVLVDSLVIEGGRKTSFLALIGGREDGVVIRIFPMLDVEKTDGVKRILAEIAKQLLEIFPELKQGATNLADWLK